MERARELGAGPGRATGSRAPSPRSRELGSWLPPPSRAEGLFPLGSRGEGLATPPPGGHVGGCSWDTCGGLL